MTFTRNPTYLTTSELHAPPESFEGWAVRQDDDGFIRMHKGGRSLPIGFVWDADRIRERLARNVREEETIQKAWAAYHQRQLRVSSCPEKQDK